jgi:2,3-bisphosphoglycerate-independent phosphoglycerate mutase
MTDLKPLPKSKQFNESPGPLVLIIMDGVGIGKNEENNAVYLAKTPYLDSLIKSPLYMQLKAHGTAVGMPTDDDMGNSEVGHNALGAGRIFEQGATLVEKEVNNGMLFEGDTWKAACKNTQDNQSTLHFIGLLSDGNVHAHIRHLKKMIEKAVESGSKKIRIHALLDGRDVEQKSALSYTNELETLLRKLNANGADCKIASGGGRMITTMDRYNADWSIVKYGWDAHVLGKARQFDSADQAILSMYEEDPEITDQYLPSFVVAENGTPIGTIEDNDSVIFFNFRGDRAIEISMAFEQDNFDKFDRERVPNVFFAGMMQYDGDLQLPKNFLVNPPQIDHSISDYLCANKISSFAISETQKYGHVTYFWNGNKSGYIDKSLETFVEIESDRIPFDQRPEMKAHEITEKSIEMLKSGNFKFGRINFPNGDMVGHTGSMPATIKACEVTDECVKKIAEVVNKLNGITLILADHGNADEMFTIKNGTKLPKTSHTLNPVPFAIVDSNYKEDYFMNKKIETPGLANVASTICNLLGLDAPLDYETSLISFL